MLIVPANARLLSPEGLTPYQFIERIGRTCYKSEDRITDNSALNFVERMVSNKHYAMLEHYRMYMVLYDNVKEDIQKELDLLRKRSVKGSAITYSLCDHFIITPCSSSFTGEISLMSGNLRTFLELKDALLAVKSTYMMINITTLFPTLCQICGAWSHVHPELFNGKDFGWSLAAVDSMKAVPLKSVDDVFALESDKRILMAHVPHTVKFTCDRGVSHEFVRHRPANFAGESTRYCNYNNNKFEQQITVVAPCFYDENSDAYKRWYANMCHCETTYLALINECGAKPQEARANLPHSVKTELFVTATEEEWQHIINLRYYGTTGAPHPQAKEVMDIIYPVLVDVSDKRLK